MTVKVAFLTGLLLACMTSTGGAQENWTYPVRLIDPPRKAGIDDPVIPGESKFQALDPSKVKKHEICMLLPQTQDTIFLAYIYGAVTESKRLGQSLTIFDAGGVENAAQQRAQFDNCVTLGASAIILQASLASGWNAQIKQAHAQGVKIIESSEPIDSPTDGRALGNYIQAGGVMADIVLKDHKGAEPARVLVLPGAAGVKFVEDTATGIKHALEGKNAVIQNVMYGGLDSAAQLKLVEDALITYPDVQYILGNAMAIHQAANVLRQRKLTGKIKLVSSWIDPEVGTDIKSGTVLAAVTESSTMMTKIAINLAVAAVEGRGIQDVLPAAGIVTIGNIDAPETSETNYAPDGWKPEFRVQ